MTKKIIITLSIIAIIIIGIEYFFPNNKQIDTSPIEEIDANSFFTLAIEEEDLSKLAQVDEINISDFVITEAISIKEVALNKVVSIYSEIDTDELLKKMPTKKLVAPMLSIKVTQNSISSLAVGDTIKLPALGQVEYEAKITKKTMHKNASTSVSGNLVGDQNSKYSVVLTEGKTTSYASITTPEGAYEIETINGQGYIYSVKDIEAQYIDPDKEDILVPPTQGQ